MRTRRAGRSNGSGRNVGHSRELGPDAARPVRRSADIRRGSRSRSARSTGRDRRQMSGASYPDRRRSLYRHGERRRRHRASRRRPMPRRWNGWPTAIPDAPQRPTQKALDVGKSTSRASTTERTSVMRWPSIPDFTRAWRGGLSGLCRTGTMAISASGRVSCQSRPALDHGVYQFEIWVNFPMLSPQLPGRQLPSGCFVEISSRSCFSGSAR